MESALIVSIVFGSILAFTALVCFTLIFLVRMRHSATKKGRAARDEEATMIQEIYEGLTKIEQRIETLETILMERQEKE